MFTISCYCYYLSFERENNIVTACDYLLSSSFMFTKPVKKKRTISCYHATNKKICSSFLNDVEVFPLSSEKKKEFFLSLCSCIKKNPIHQFGVKAFSFLVVSVY